MRGVSVLTASLSARLHSHLLSLRNPGVGYREDSQAEWGCCAEPTVVVGQIKEEVCRNQAPEPPHQPHPSKGLL